MEFCNTPELKTVRLILRKFTQHDIQALLMIHKDREVNTYLPWFPLKSIDDAEEFYRKRHSEEYGSPRGYRYAVCLRSYNEPIGYVNVSMDDAHDFGYGLRKEFWHKGIVTEAAKAVVEQVNKDGIPYITATHDINNPRSGRVMKRLGMTCRYSYEEQWQPKNILVTFRMYQLNFDRVEGWVYKKYWDTSRVHAIEKGV